MFLVMCKYAKSQSMYSMMLAWMLFVFLFLARISEKARFLQLCTLTSQSWGYKIPSSICLGWQQVWRKHAETGIHMDRWTSGQIQGQICSCHVNIWWHSACPSCRSSFVPDGHKIRLPIAHWKILSLPFQQGCIISLIRNTCEATEMLIGFDVEIWKLQSHSKRLGVF